MSTHCCNPKSSRCEPTSCTCFPYTQCITQSRGKRGTRDHTRLQPHNLDLTFAAAADIDAETPMLGGTAQQWSIGTHVEPVQSGAAQAAAAQPTLIPSLAVTPRRVSISPSRTHSRIPSPTPSTQSPARRAQKGFFGCLSPTRRTAAVACLSDNDEVVARYGGILSSRKQHSVLGIDYQHIHVPQHQPRRS